MDSDGTAHLGRATGALWLGVSLFAASSVVAPDIAQAAPPRVRVRGAAKLTAHAAADATPAGATPARAVGLVFSGVLTDDAGQPLGERSVIVRLTRDDDPDDGRVAGALAQARGCDGGPVRARAASDAPEVAVVTDEGGRFCFRAPLEPDRYRARLAFAATDLIDAAEKDVVFDLARNSLALRFDPRPRVVDLDAPASAFEVAAVLDGAAEPRAAPGLEIVLTNGGAELGRAVTDRAGRARFSIPGARFGPPGREELRASFAGDDAVAPAVASETIERRRAVTMGLAAEPVAGVPEEGIPLVVEVATSVAPLDEGTVEAKMGERVVGAARVERGVAHLTLTFAGQGGDALVKLRYVAASPWYAPPHPMTVRVPVRAPSLASKMPMLLAGLVVLALFLLGRVAGRRRPPRPSARKADRSVEARPGIEVLRAARQGRRGWVGRVVDAHDGRPVRGARVSIERGTFEGRALLASVETDEDGRFSIGDIGALHGGELLAAEARLHARLTQPLPPAGELLVTIAERRRALLASLVAWARRRGAPFDARPEPTPGHVRRAASEDAEAARWADALEQTVFGPGEVDAHAAHAVTRLAPADAAPEEPPKPRRDEAPPGSRP